MNQSTQVAHHVANPGKNNTRPACSPFLRAWLPFISVFTAYALVMAGGLPQINFHLRGNFGWIPRFLHHLYLHPVQAGNSSSPVTSGTTATTGPSLSSSSVESHEDTVSGEGPQGLLVTFRWKPSTQSYRIEANQPSTQYEILATGSTQPPIAEGTTAPLNEWIVSTSAAAAMGMEGLTLKYRTSAGEVELNLSTSLIVLGNIDFPTHILPNAMYRLTYQLSRTLPDMTSLPPAQRPSLRIHITGEHLSRPRTLFFPLESKKGGGEIVFVLNHDDIEELNPRFKVKLFWNQAPIQITYQLHLSSGTSFTVDGKTFHMLSEPSTLERHVLFPLLSYSISDNQSRLTDASVTFTPSSSGSTSVDATKGALTISGAQPDDLLVCSAWGNYANHAYLTRTILGAWPVALFLGSSSGSSASNFSIPVEKVMFQLVPYTFDYINPYTMGVEDAELGFSWALVRQDKTNPLQISISDDTSIPADVLLGPFYSGPLFAQIGNRSKQALESPANIRTTFVPFGVQPGFYDPSRQTRLYSGNFSFSQMMVSPDGYTHHASYPTNFVVFTHIFAGSYSDPTMHNVYVGYLSSIESPLYQQFRPCTGNSPHYHGLHFSHVNHAQLMNFHIEAMDWNGDPLYVSYDPVYIDNNLYRSNFPYEDIPPENSIWWPGFRLELPTDCQKYPVILKVRARLKAGQQVITRSGAVPYSNRVPHIGYESGNSSVGIESSQVVTCPDLVHTNAPSFEETHWLLVYPPSTVSNCPPDAYANSPLRAFRYISDVPAGFSATEVPFWKLITNDDTRRETSLTALRCLNCPGPDALVVIPPDSPINSNLSINRSPFIPMDIIRKWVRSIAATINSTTEEWIHLHVQASLRTGNNNFTRNFILRVHRPAVFFDLFVPKVAGGGVAVNATTPCPDFHYGYWQGEMRPFQFRVCDTPQDPIFPNADYRSEQSIHVRFYYPGLPTRHSVYLAYLGFPFIQNLLTPGTAPFGSNRTNQFRIGIRPQEIPPGTNIYDNIDGFGTIYKLSGAVDENGQFVPPFYTILPHSGSYHNPAIHSTLGHMVVGDKPVAQNNSECPEFPNVESVKITPAEPPPSNSPMTITVEINASNYDYGVISGGLEPVIFFRNGSYQVRIPGGRNRRGITVTLHADGCPTAIREILFPPVPVRPAGWRIGADPAFPVVQSAPVTGQERIYWQGPTFQSGIPVLKTLSARYQEKFGHQLPNVPQLPSRKGTCHALNVKPTGTRWKTW